MTTAADNAPAAPAVPPGTIQVWSDLLCPFAYVALLRLRRARERLGLDGIVRLEHRTFPLELFNGPHPRRGTDTEAVGLGQIEPVLEDSAREILDDLGRARCVVWVDIARPDRVGDSQSTMNAALDRAVSGRTNVRILHWSALVDAQADPFGLPLALLPPR